MILFAKKCTAGGTHHKFQPRYVTNEEFPANFQSISHDINMQQAGFFVPDIIKNYKVSKQTYYGDVCVWCGKVVNAPIQNKA